MKKMIIYVDTSVIGGCEDEEFSTITRRLWTKFEKGKCILAISDLTLQEIKAAPKNVRANLDSIPNSHLLRIPFSEEAKMLAEAYLAHGIAGPGSLADALHVALATAARVDVLVSWNFRHIVNLGRIRLFNAVNLEEGYGLIEIRAPKEVLDDQDI